MTLLWSPVIVAGLLILVYLMIAGVPFVDDGRGSTHGSRPRTLLPMAGTFLTVGGLVGYLLWTSDRLALQARSLSVLGVAIAAALAVRWIVKASFAAPSTDPEDDPRYRWQGQVARLTTAIDSGTPGRVMLHVDGQAFDFAAVAIDGQPIPADTEVVIERLDGELATVERWAAVEARL